MAKLFLGDTEIAPIIEVPTGGTIDLYPREDLGIIQNEYYTNSQGSITAYNGWDRTSLIDVSDVDYVLMNWLEWPTQYAVYQGSLSSKNTFITCPIDNTLYRLYNVSDCTQIGFSRARTYMNNLVLYKVRSNNAILTRALIDGVAPVQIQPATLSLRSAKRAVAEPEVITYPEPTEV